MLRRRSARSADRRAAISRMAAARARTAASVAVTSLVLTAAGLTLALPHSDAATLAASEAKAAAFEAIQDQYLALGSPVDAAMARLFTGPALDEMRQLSGHIRQLIEDETDYPGRMTLSNVRGLTVAGEYATTVAIDFTAHAKLANMKGGATVDFSEADGIFHVVVVKDAGVWKVGDLSWDFAPGSGP